MTAQAVSDFLISVAGGVRTSVRGVAAAPETDARLHAATDTVLRRVTACSHLLQLVARVGFRR